MADETKTKTAGETVATVPAQTELDKITAERNAARDEALQLRAENETLRNMLGDLNDLVDGMKKKAGDSLDSAARLAGFGAPVPGNDSDPDGGR